MSSSAKGYQLDDDEQYRLSSLPGVTVYSLGGALAEAVLPVYEYFLKETGCARCAMEAVRREVDEALPDAIAGCPSAFPKLCKDHTGG